MLIQRTIHLDMPWQTAKAKLLSLQEYRHTCWGLKEITSASDSPSGETHLHLTLPGGINARFHIATKESENETQLSFRSHHGNVEVIGMLEFFEIEPGSTEVVITLTYLFSSLLTQTWAVVWNSGERFLDRNLPLIEAHFQRQAVGIRADKNLAQPINGHPPKPATD